MPENGIPEGDITRAELAGLAELFDGFEFARNPLSRDAAEAEVQFNSRVQAMFDERVFPSHPKLSFVAFQARVRLLCRLYLRKISP